MPPQSTARKRRAIRTIANEPIRAVAYLRLSRAKPKPGDTEVGLDTQLAGCQRAIEVLGGAIAATEQDILAGDRIDRPGLWRAIERIRTGEANALIVYAIDRFGRDSVQQGVAVHAIRAAGGRLISATQNLEEGPLGEFMRHVYEFAGAIELASIRERTARGIDAKFRQAKRYKPGKRPPYGYRRVADSSGVVTYEMDPAEAAAVRHIFTQRAAGVSLRQIVLRLNADGILSPLGGKWNPSTLHDIANRGKTYATGEHECWLTRIERDANNVPYVVDRPPEERYTVSMPTIIDVETWQRAEAAAKRHVWFSRRSDRPAEYGLLRYGFARCAYCGRALAVSRGSYVCSQHGNQRPCTTPPTITVESLDSPILTWLQAIIEDPGRANAYRVERQVHTPDPEALAAALAAEQQVADLEQRANTLIDNLGLLSGAAAQLAAERLNALNDDLDAARVMRDRLVAACRVTLTEEASALVPQDVLASAILDAIKAMVAAAPDAEHTFTVLLPLPEGAAEYAVPLSWKAWQAALSVLNVSVTVAQEKSGLPRWVAEMRPSGGVAVSSNPKDYLFASGA